MPGNLLVLPQVFRLRSKTLPPETQTRGYAHRILRWRANVAMPPARVAATQASPILLLPFFADTRTELRIRGGATQRQSTTNTPKIRLRQCTGRECRRKTEHRAHAVQQLAMTNHGHLACQTQGCSRLLPRLASRRLRTCIDSFGSFKTS